MKRLIELFEDEQKEISFSRVQGVLVFLFVIANATYLTLKGGKAVEIPESWLTLLGISMGGYLGTKGIARLKNDDVKEKGDGPQEG